ncbi:REX4, RNA exonuclease 4 [Cichlidogyrus casuarinus]|uniref:REX4, RNA exonuclease 4 n=1 Tax=Cichlidogyrus casuarinus TaxID=1844966 RepID=A0ABD2QBV6_9PLAT
MLVRNAHIIVRSSVSIDSEDAIIYNDNFQRVFEFKNDSVNCLPSSFQCTAGKSNLSKAGNYIITSSENDIYLMKLDDISSTCSTNSIFCTGTNDGQFIFWDLASNDKPKYFQLRSDEITACCYIEEINMIVTACDNGVLQFHDPRDSKSAQIFDPNAEKEVVRPELGTWISVLEFDPSSPTWLLFGGAPKLGLFNFRMMKHCTILSQESTPKYWYPETAKFARYNNESIILAGGNSNTLFGWSHDAQPKLECALPTEGKSAISHITTIDTNRNDDIFVGGVSASIHKIRKPACIYQQIPICFQ